MSTISNLLDKAKRCIGASDASLKEAAEYIAAATAQGATQDRIAKAVGKSPTWVSRLLRWQHSGFKDTPFGPQAKQARAVRRLRESRPATLPTAPEQIAKAETQRAQFEFQRVRAQAVVAMFGATISNGLRLQLVNALSALPSDHPAERVRARLGMSWDELVVPAAAESERSAAA